MKTPASPFRPLRSAATGLALVVLATVAFGGSALAQEPSAYEAVSTADPFDPNAELPSLSMPYGIVAPVTEIAMGTPPSDHGRHPCPGTRAGILARRGADVKDGT